MSLFRTARLAKTERANRGEFLSGNPKRMVVYLSRLKQQMPSFKLVGPDQGKAGGIFHAWLNLYKRIQSMTKSLEIITEAIRNPKPPFRKVDNQPKKPLKHRYERRKIKEYLHIGEWAASEGT